MECVGQAHKVSQNKDLNQTNAEPNAKTADPAIFFSFFTLKLCEILSKIKRDISHKHFEV